MPMNFNRSYKASNVDNYGNNSRFKTKQSYNGSKVASRTFVGRKSSNVSSSNSRNIRTLPSPHVNSKPKVDFKQEVKLKPFDSAEPVDSISKDNLEVHQVSLNDTDVELSSSSDNEDVHYNVPIKNRFQVLRSKNCDQLNTENQL